MSEMMRPLPFGKLMRWAMEEYRKEGRIFGIRREKFFKTQDGAPLSLFGQALASPVGPAAGPHSQLAQNILSAFLCGSRFMELKTVQKTDGDELRAAVPRPCIHAQDEGYNVEWSTELTVPAAYEEYVKAWVAVHVLCKELGLGKEPGVIFNMSVGYDLAGIQTEKIDRFIEGLKDASQSGVFQGCLAWLRENLFLFRHIGEADIAAVPARVSGSVTLSTLHGCPPEEIERIAAYLLAEKGVHTFVKCNPTLLGYQAARRLLDEMGYGYVEFDEHHFQNDLQFEDAVPMLGRLMAAAQSRGLRFGVKLTNTFPVRAVGTLPGEEMYMSGRALFPLSIHVARRLSDAFGGTLPISYSGGADAFNIADIFNTGIWPITVATTLLKPGGYERLYQLAGQLAPLAAGAPAAVDTAALGRLADTVTQLAPYQKQARLAGNRKTTIPLGLYDCFMAPCQSGGCPIGQQIPAYLKLVSEGRYDEAFAVIAVDNALPGITGAICSHACQGKCTRMDMDAPLAIREAKRLAGEAAQTAYTAALQPPPPATGKRAVVVGAGPAGVAAALFLRRAGMAVTVLEKREKPFGIVEYIIPAFRLSAETLQRDFAMAQKMGVDFRFGVADALNVPKLREEYDYVILALGAWQAGAPAVREGQEHLLDALAFLEESKANGCRVALGRRVAVIGGGDVAMDCARAARRAPGVQEVTLVYRRTRAFMPAEAEEIRLALAEGVSLVELRAPLSYDGAYLVCEKMALSGWDESGRRGIAGTGEAEALPFDSVIGAVGARVDAAPFQAAGIRLHRGLPLVNPMNECNLPGVYIAGDCKKGPATVVAAIADAKLIAWDICYKNGLDAGFHPAGEGAPLPELYARKGVLQAPQGGPGDGRRCLGCDALCEICCDVCPNRANVRVAVPGFAAGAQILHIDALCNECGNCGVFCPHAGNPYKDKMTLFGSEEDFYDSENVGFLPLADTRFLLRLPGGYVLAADVGDPLVPAEMSAFIEAVLRQAPWYL